MGLSRRHEIIYEAFREFKGAQCRFFNAVSATLEDDRNEPSKRDDKAVAASQDAVNLDSTYDVIRYTRGTFFRCIDEKNDVFKFVLPYLMVADIASMSLVSPSKWPRDTLYSWFVRLRPDRGGNRAALWRLLAYSEFCHANVRKGKVSDDTSPTVTMLSSLENMRRKSQPPGPTPRSGKHPSNRGGSSICYA